MTEQHNDIAQQIPETPPVLGIISRLDAETLATSEVGSELSLAVLSKLGHNALDASFDGVAIMVDETSDGEKQLRYVSLRGDNTLGDSIGEKVQERLGLPPVDRAHADYVAASTVEQALAPEITVTQTDINQAENLNTVLLQAKKTGTNPNHAINDTNVLTVSEVLLARGEMSPSGVLAVAGQIISAAEAQSGLDEHALKLIEKSTVLTPDQKINLRTLSNNMLNLKMRRLPLRDIEAQLRGDVSHLLARINASDGPKEAYVITLRAMEAGLSGDATMLMSNMQKLQLN